MPPIHSDRPGAHATRPSVAEVSGPAITRAVEEHAMRFIPAVVAARTQRLPSRSVND